MKSQILYLLLIVALVAGPSIPQKQGERPAGDQKPDPRLLDHKSTPLRARFPDGLSDLRREKVQLGNDDVTALSFQRFVADRPGAMSAELALIPVGRGKGFRVNPRRRLRAMADLLRREPNIQGLREAWAWHEGFPGLQIQFRSTPELAKKSSAGSREHKVVLVHYPDGIAFLQVIANDPDALNRVDVREFLAGHRHKKAKAPIDFEFESPGAKLSYMAGTQFDALDGVLRLGAPDGSWGLAISEWDTLDPRDPCVILAEILSDAVDERGALQVLKGPKRVSLPGDENLRFRLDYLEPQREGPPLRRVFIYLKSKKTRTLLSGYSTTMVNKSDAARPYSRLEPLLLVPLSTFERKIAVAKKSG